MRDTNDIVRDEAGEPPKLVPKQGERIVDVRFDVRHPPAHAHSAYRAALESAYIPPDGQLAEVFPYNVLDFLDWVPDPRDARNEEFMTVLWTLVSGRHSGRVPRTLGGVRHRLGEKGLWTRFFIRGRPSATR